MKKPEDCGEVLFVFFYIDDFSPCIEPSLDVCRERNVSSCFIFLETFHKCLFLPVASWETFKGRLQINTGKKDQFSSPGVRNSVCL